MSKNKKIIIGALILVVTLVVGSFLYIVYNYNKYSYVEPDIEKNIEYAEKDTKNEIKEEASENIDKNTNEEEKEPEYTVIDGITNILLIGSDARKTDKVSRSDTIMILSLDDVHKKIKLTSIMRDTYADIPGYGEQKINHSFVYGGVNLLAKTIENNFNLKINKYAIIDFSGFKELVQAVGGLDIDVKANEISDLNDCMYGIHEENIVEVTEPGLQHLNPQQVLGYVRMRHTGDGCEGRTERQRKVVNMIIDELKDTSLIKYPSVATKLMPCVKTNIEFTEAINLAYTAYKINNFNFEQLQIPVAKLSEERLYKDKGSVILMDKKDNVKVLQNFIFEDIAYDESKYRWFVYENSPYYYVEPVEEVVEIEETKEDKKDKEEEIDPILRDLLNGEDKENIISEDENTEDIKENNKLAEVKNLVNQDKVQNNNSQNISEDTNILPDGTPTGDDGK